MLTNVKPNEACALLAQIDPSSQSAGAATSGWLDMSNYHKLLALIAIGALGSSATVDAKIQQATSSAGAGAKDITSKAITQHTSGNNKQKLIQVSADDLDAANGFRYVQLSVTVGTAATLTAASVLGFFPRDSLALANNATVTEVVG